MKLLIVSGLSGSGKSVALHTLEDEDFYCIDNLHMGLLPAFVKQLLSPGLKLYDKAAVGIDARSGIEDLARFPQIVAEIESSGLDVEIIFLQADVETLITRFSETRRKHPLTREGLPLVEAIHLERSLLEAIASRADLKIDTTRTNVHQLRALIRERIRTSVNSSLYLLFQSFGYKHGVPPDADYVFDARCLPNPHWEPELRDLTGRDSQVIDYLRHHSEVEELLLSIRDFLTRWIPCYEAENRSYLSISIGCTGGRHRSVYLAERLAAYFKEAGHENVSVRHRELQ
ncbi:MAG TPA: RNase adapter RapZ [Gammaproteobacteria bacterium]|nr:RNase adapter RapZ [Gammaproteobacteria bacterium]